MRQALLLRQPMQQRGQRLEAENVSVPGRPESVLQTAWIFAQLDRQGFVSPTPEPGYEGLAAALSANRVLPVGWKSAP